MPEARASVLVRRPREEVFAFHADAANLERVVPFGALRAVDGGTLAPGRGVEVELRAGPFVRRGRIEVSEMDPPRSFTDVQRAGPFSRWEHHHALSETFGGTVVEDTVRFGLAGAAAPLGALLAPLVAFALRRKLRRTASLLERRG